MNRKIFEPTDLVANVVDSESSPSRCRKNLNLLIAQIDTTCIKTFGNEASETFQKKTFSDAIDSTNTNDLWFNHFKISAAILNKKIFGLKN